jgi:hypothetical protein
LGVCILGLCEVTILLHQQVTVFEKMSLLVLLLRLDSRLKSHLVVPKKKKRGLQDQLFGRRGEEKRRNRMLMLDLKIIPALVRRGYLHPIPLPRHVYSPILLRAQAGVGMIVREFRK